MVRTCDIFHYLTTIYLETFRRISVTKDTCTDQVVFSYQSLRQSLLSVCSLGLHDFRLNPLLHFYNTGLSGSDMTNTKGWRLRTFPSLLIENNHTEVCRCTFNVGVYTGLNQICQQLLSHMVNHLNRW